MHSKLNQTERELLSSWKQKGISNKECGRRLGRDASTIGRELKRNPYWNPKTHEYFYESLNAQQQAEARKKRAWEAKQPLKNSIVYGYVLEKLREGWSPEEIAGRLREDHPQEKEYHLVHETIYQYIYAKEQKDLKLWEYLPRKQKRRRKKQGRKVHRVRIPDRVSIHERAESINTRMVFGHWEADTVEGKGHREGIHTEVERVSRFMMAQKISRIASEETIAVQQKLFASLPEQARHSVTMDNGRENHQHTKLKELGMQTYFADPYSSWQRGTNEYHNGLLRRYLPKKTSFTTLTQEELDEIISEINNRPRKVLQYKTPTEVFTKLLKGCDR